MRDVEQMREKYELALDGRQVAALALGALVLLCCVFALGLGLGKRLAQQQAPAADLDALDAQVAPRREPAKPAVQKPSPPADKAEKAEKAPEPVAAKPAEAQAAPKPPPDAEAAAAPASKDAIVVPPPAREALVVPPPPKAQVASVVLTPPPANLGAFTVQIGASPDRAEASRLENRARGAGLKPYVVEADLGAKGTWYRVRVGSFPDKDSATRFRKDVERELRASAVVMPTK
jgi:cell division protein FtsN